MAERDYRREYKQRVKSVRRLAADIDKAKAEAFREFLTGQGLTFTKWLNIRIDEEIKRGL
jgi:hypothetical protein